MENYTYDLDANQATASDGWGTTTFSYNAYGELVSETISGEYTKTLYYDYDTYGRDAGYSINEWRMTTLGYDAATGRLATMNEGGNFSWEYLPGSDLKSKLTYPNGVTANWTYEANRDLLTNVINKNADGSVISSYTYANDVLGRRTAKNDEVYGYNTRDELISADEVTFAYDDIGNRTVAEGKNYTANNLNQYTAIDTFTPTYDLDGNQTTVLTSTGIWTVEYNAENRPIRWTQGNKVVTMDFDRMGRRIYYKEMEGDTQTTYTKFVYKGYLCVQQVFSNELWEMYKEFIWDPTEPTATRPLCFRLHGQFGMFFTHDGNKNVSDLITVGPFNTVVAHYDYAPFGAVTSQTGSWASDNPFRFSSEFHDDTLGLVYYNYRHYNPADARWLGRDPIEEQGGVNIYATLNDTLNHHDLLGLSAESCWALINEIGKQFQHLLKELAKYDPKEDAKGGHIYFVKGVQQTTTAYGHAEEIRNDVVGLKHKLTKFVEECLCGDDNNYPPYPKNIDVRINQQEIKDIIKNAPPVPILPPRIVPPRGAPNLMPGYPMQAPCLLPQQGIGGGSLYLNKPILLN